MQAFLEFVWTVLAFALIALVLLHSPKGDGIAAIGGQAQMFSSTKTAEANLNRITWSVLAGFLTVTVVLSAGWLTVAAQ